MQLRRFLPTAILPFVLLSALSALSFSQTAAVPLQVHCLLNPSVPTDIGTCIGEAVSLSAVGLALSLAIVALTYMIGEVFNMGNLRGWYRRELWETTKSLLLVGVIYSALVLGGGIASALAGNAQATAPALLGQATLPTCSPYPTTVQAQSTSALATNLASLYNVALGSYLQPALCYSQTAFAAMFGLSIGTEAAKTLAVKTWFPVPIFPPFVFSSLQFGSTAQIFQSTYFESITAAPTFSFLYDVIKILIVPTMFVLQYQADLLPAIVLVGLGVFIPFGILLRAIPFLRNIGGTMVAIGIGLSLVYPAMLVTLNLPITDYFIGITYNTQAAPQTQCGGNVVCLVLSSIASPEVLFPLQIALGSANTNAAISAAETGSNIGFWSYTIGLDSIFPAINLVDQYVLNILVQLFLFVFDIILGVTFIQAIARSLGGQLRLSLGRRIRLA